MQNFKIFADPKTLDPQALQQFMEAMAVPNIVKGALMPDAHKGYTLPIGGVIASDGVVYPSAVGFDIGCLDADTEFLTKFGWKKISEYTDEDSVAQYNKVTDEIEFIIPERYIKRENDFFYHFKNSGSLDQMLSKDHKVLMWNNRNTDTKDWKAEDLVLHHNKLSKGVQEVFKTTFGNTTSGIGYTDDELRLLVMISADGCVRSISKDGLNKIELHVKKERKVERACLLLDKADVYYKLSEGKNNHTYIYFSLAIDKDLSILWGASAHQLNIVCDEVFNWDGHNGEHSFYSTSIKEHADIIQYAFAVNNVRCRIYTNTSDKVNREKTYLVCLTNNEYIGITKDCITKVESKDGYEYCFTVPSGYFVARRNNKIFITGNCGMCAAVVNGVTKEDIEHPDVRKSISEDVYKKIPVGFKSHDSKNYIFELTKHNHTEISHDIWVRSKTHPLRQLGTLGGGNHFIEIGYDRLDRVWVVIHSGSRNYGWKIAQTYMIMASGTGKASEGFYGFDADSINGKNYIIDQKLALSFALTNRKNIMEKVCEIVGEGYDKESFINRNHNHVEKKDGLWIHRKGATHAEEGMMGVIPGNMRDGSFIVRGKGNPDSLYSSSHGAGRVLGRKQAKRELSIEEFKSTMKGIEAKVIEDTLDESPMAYKDIFEVMELQKDLVDVLYYIKPIVNIKG